MKTGGVDAVGQHVHVLGPAPLLHDVRSDCFGHSQESVCPLQRIAFDFAGQWSKRKRLDSLPLDDKRRIDLQEEWNAIVVCDGGAHVTK
jgi:hypothetical protein